jgi:tetratricopeptide (TPR) repeat protein
MAEAHDGLGDVHFARRAWKEAAEAYRAAIRLKPNLSRAHNNLGNTLQRLGDVDGAIAAHRRAIAADPGTTVAHGNLGSLLVQRDPAEACKLLRVAIGRQPDSAELHCNLGIALTKTGDFAAAVAALQRGHELGSRRPGWPYPSAQWLDQSRNLLALDQKLAAVARGEASPASAAERAQLATIALTHRKRYALAARLFSEAFAAEPKLADLPAGHRYNAACSAARAAAGQGVDAGALDDQEKANLRRQAFDWLRADLAWQRKQLQNWWPGTAGQAVKNLQHWQKDPDLANLRDPKALATLPPTEREQFRQLWAEVAGVLVKTRKP